MFEGIIFDVEGTLVDSVSQNLRSLQDALEKSGHRVPIQTLRLYSGLDGDQTLQLTVPDALGRERMAILEDRREIYERDYLPSVRPLEGARDVLRILTQQGGRIALATWLPDSSVSKMFQVMRTFMPPPPNPAPPHPLNGVARIGCVHCYLAISISSSRRASLPTSTAAVPRHGTHS